MASSQAKKRKLSESINGKAILIDSTSSDIHVAVAGTTAGTFDEIWLWAYNSHSADVVLTIEFGGDSVPDQNIVVTIPYKAGLVPVVPGLILQNSMVVSAFSSVDDVITIIGFVNAITD